jgi:hypothetical protein
MLIYAKLSSIIHGKNNIKNGTTQFCPSPNTTLKSAVCRYDYSHFYLVSFKKQTHLF